MSHPGAGYGAAAQHGEQDLKNPWAAVIWGFVTGFQSWPIRAPATTASGPTDRSALSISAASRCSPSRRGAARALDRAAIEGRKHYLRELKLDLGMFTSGSAVTTDNACQWYAEILHESLVPSPSPTLPTPRTGPSAS